MALEKQVDKSHYQFGKYVGKNHRWVSFYHQLDELFKLPNLSSVLEVGPGMPLVRDMLAYHAPTVTYRSLDLAADLEPDVLGSVTRIPLEDDSFDVVCAFQILEHIPYEEFETALTEMARVSRGPVLISVPHFGPAFRLLLKIPMLPKIEVAQKIPYPIQHQWNGQHYWEIGKRGYPLRRIIQDMEKYFTLERTYIPFENQCHRFFVLRKK